MERSIHQTVLDQSPAFVEALIKIQECMKKNALEISNYYKAMFEAQQRLVMYAHPGVWVGCDECDILFIEEDSEEELELCGCGEEGERTLRRCPRCRTRDEKWLPDGEPNRVRCRVCNRRTFRLILN